ncbi:achaete-scute homolog 4 [Phyllopteryx taeniolatus]|uniref:achaete-scute homolog 4 n=1 Tax=Phyllopteryx taeniolatus TaxID=161469 RepID=UPI002AD540B4|nr:achaete-scute homolog 4 [Phyllopteryx taeniolatus]
MSSRHEIVEHIPYIPPLALHCFSVDITGSHHHFGLPSFHLEPACLDCVYPSPKFPDGGLRYYPCPGSVSVCEYSLEPAFIRKRNERERHRVRCVNEGYARLRERLPRELDDKRLSKVETLRAAIDYIKHLQGLLDVNAPGMSLEAGHKRPKCREDIGY